MKAYVSKGLKAEAHIFSIRKDGVDVPLATVEAMWDGKTFNIRQNYSVKNSAPSAEAEAAIQWFKKQLEEEKLPTSPQLGETEASKARNVRPLFLRTIGFELTQENINAALAEFGENDKRRAREFNPKTGKFDLISRRTELLAGNYTTELQSYNLDGHRPQGGNFVLLNREGVPKKTDVPQKHLPADKWLEANGITEKAQFLLPPVFDPSKSTLVQIPKPEPLPNGQLPDIIVISPDGRDVTPPVESSPQHKAATLPKTHTSTRAGGGAGAGMGAMGIAGRLGDTLDKAKKVGGKQLETERTALGGDIASVVTGLSDLTPEAAQASSKAGAALRTMGRVAPIVAAGAAYLEVRAANTAQDGRRGAGAVGGFASGMGVGMATGATAGAIFGPWGVAIGGIIGGLGAGYVGSEVGRSSQWGDQRQRDLDHKAQYALDQSVEVIAELGRKRLRGEAWTDSDKAAMRTIGTLMVEHVNRMQVLEIPATDIDGRLRQQYQIQQTQHVIDYLNGKTERLPMASQQRDAHLIASIDALLPALNDPKFGWRPWLHAGAGAVDRTDVLRTLSEYGVELHTLDKDGRKGVTLDELTTVLKALKVDQRGKVTPAHGAARVERPPEIDDETHANLRSSQGYERFKKAIEAKLPELEKLGITSAIGVEGRPLTLDDIDKTFKANGIRVSEIDRNGDGNITADEIVKALQSRGIATKDSPQQRTYR